MAPKHILIVDDEPMILFSWAVVLRQEGYRVTTVEDAFQALDRIQGAFATLDPVDLMLTDLRMPGVDGLELIRRVRSGDKSLPILVITGWGNQAIRDQVMDLDCQGYLEKPMEPKALIQVIDNVLDTACSVAAASPEAGRAGSMVEIGF